MILYKVFYNKHEVSYFMKLLIFLSMIITSSKATKLHSSQKSPLQSNLNETLSDLDFEDSINPIILSEQNYSLPNLLGKNQLTENEIKSYSSTPNIINGAKKTKKILPSKKHRNIIKMVCDSDNLISQMTLHMNFLDNSKDEKHHDFVFKKVFNPDNPSNEVLFSYPDVPDDLTENKSDETDEIQVKDDKLSVSKPYDENGSLKKDNTLNYLLLNEEYETYPVSKKKKNKTQPYSKEDYKLEIKKFNSGPRVESLKSLQDNYSPNHLKERKRNKVKFWVTAMSVTDSIEDVGKNNTLHKWRLFEQSDHSDAINSYTPEAEESHSYPGLDNSDVIPQVIEDMEQAQNNSLNEQDNNFGDKEYDGENTNNEDVLNYSKKFKKFKIANSKHVIDEHENINQLDDTFLYDFTDGYKKQYHNKILKKDNGRVEKGKSKKIYKSWKSNLITQPKGKSIISHDRAQLLGFKSSAAIADKKKKTLQRQKVIDNLKFILSKQRNEHPKTENNLQSKYFSREKIKDASKMLNFPKKFEKKNSTKLVDNSDNFTNNELLQKDDKEAESSSATEKIVFAYENKNLPFDIYDIEMNDNDLKTKLRNKDFFYQVNNEKHVDQKNFHSKYDVPFKLENKLTNKRDVCKLIPEDSNQLQKYPVKRMANDKEEIREDVFLEKGIPLQFNPNQKISNLNNKRLLGLQSMSPICGSQKKLRNGNDKQYTNTENSFKSIQHNNFQLNPENFKIDVKRNALMEKTYQKACHRFLRDIALIKFLNDNSESIFFSD